VVNTHPAHRLGGPSQPEPSRPRCSIIRSRTGASRALRVATRSASGWPWTRPSVHSQGSDRGM